MAITLEAIRAAGGIVHSDGNIFFRNISMLQGLAGAAPAAVAPEHPPMPETWAVVASIEGQDVVCISSSALSGKGELTESEEQAVIGMAQHLLAFVGYGLPPCDFDPDDEPAPAPALEAPAAPPGFDAWWERAGDGRSKLMAKQAWHAALAAAPQAPAQEAPAAPVCERCGLSPAEHNPTHWCDNQSFAAAAPQAPAAPSAIATQVIENMLQLARIVNTAVEDWGESFEDGSSEVTFHKEEADKLEEILEFFDSLPDAPPEEGVILSGPSRAARVLRAMAAPAAPAVDAETIHLQDLKNALAKCKELRQQLTLMDEHQAGTVWRWQADSQDKLETMGNRMGVLIYACDLRALLAGAAPAVDADPLGLRDVGEAFMQAIERNSDALKAVGWPGPMDCPSEIVADLLNLLEEANTTSALGEWVATLEVDSGGGLDYETVPPCTLPPGCYPLYRAAQAKEGGEA
ncbi:hypothetical protein ACF8PL_18840 [Delftia sp. WSY_4]|uniref:hypothetical protein n=1 Tax=unclassified Delftia TaxID=2613839 RepID=UPI00370B6A2E